KMKNSADTERRAAVHPPQYCDGGRIPPASDPAHRDRGFTSPLRLHQLKVIIQVNVTNSNLLKVKTHQPRNSFLHSLITFPHGYVILSHSAFPTPRSALDRLPIASSRLCCSIPQCNHVTNVTM